MLHSFGVKGDGDAKTLDDSKRVQVKGEYIYFIYVLLLFYYDVILAKRSWEPAKHATVLLKNRVKILSNKMAAMNDPWVFFFSGLASKKANF